MIGISHIGTYIPSSFLNNSDRQNDFDISDDFIINKIGVKQVVRKSDLEDTSDLCVAAYKRLAGKIGYQALEKMDVIAVCTQNPDGGGIPHTAAIVHGKINKHIDCASFDISLGCSGYVYALSIVKAFMEANAMRNGLLFTADPYSKIIDPMDKNTALLFGDAATVTHLVDDVSGGTDIWKLGKVIFNTVGTEWRALHNHGGQLHMNGRSIFNFAMRYVPTHIRKLLKQLQLTENDIDLYLLHQGSQYILEQLRRRMQLPIEKVPVKMDMHGNTVSSSIPLILEEYFLEDSIRKIVLCGFGVGLSCATGLIYK